MFRSARFRAALALSAAVLLVAGVVGVAALSTRRLAGDADELTRTHDAIAQIYETLALASETEASARAYAVTGRRDALAPFEKGTERLPAATAALRQLLADQPPQLERLDELQRLLRDRLAHSRNIVEVRNRHGLEGVRQLLVQEGAASEVLERIHAVADGMVAYEALLLEERETTMGRTAQWTMRVVLLGGLLSLALVAVSFFLLHREIGVRRHAVATSLRRLSEIEALAQISHYLQACNGPEEAYAYTAQALAELVPGSSGALAMLGPAPDTLETVAQWGAPGVLRAFERDACWSLRRSAEHAWPGDATAPVCAHVTAPRPAAYVCLPLMTQGAAIGVLHVATPDPAGLGPDRRAVIAGAAEQAALALANLQLRERLRRESLRDPLTGVHNRRFLDEALPRELALAQRRGRPISVALIDADHFKLFNDRHGHEAGDQVLRALGELLRDRFRGTDIVCRYGGEEFVIVLPDAGLEDALERAEDVRVAARAMALTAAGRELPPVTLSIGVACCPDHASSAGRLLRAADTALYAAKSAGRDRVVAAEAPTGAL